MILRIFAASMCALGLGLLTESAKAGQTFVCEDGRLLQVDNRDIERLKREDMCVAAHFGMKLQPVPLPVKRPAIPAIAALKGAQAPEAGRKPVATVAAVATDYRNVRIINAGPGTIGWYRHTR